jgi:hypothetical protein
MCGSSMRPAFLFGGDVRRNRGPEAVGIDQRARCRERGCREQTLDVLVDALLVEAGGDGFHRQGGHACPTESVQQRAGDEGLADFGVGAGDEPAACVFQLFIFWRRQE